MKHKVHQAGLSHVGVSSAGTGAYHIGEKPDPRSIKAGTERGYRLDGQYASQISHADFYEYDMILAMDRDNLNTLRAICPHDAKAKLQLLLDYHPDESVYDVPDPYYGGELGFTKVIHLIEDAVDSLIDQIR